MMIIYEFSTWWSNNELPYSVKVIEVEEKPKTYIGRNTRILKSEINKLLTNYANRYYSLINDPQPYIEAMIERKRNRVQTMKDNLKDVIKDLEKWEALKVQRED